MMTKETRRKLRRIRKRVKNFILKTLLIINVVVFFCVMCGVEPTTDADMVLVVALYLGPLAYISVFCYVNGLM